MGLADTHLGLEVAKWLSLHTQNEIDVLDPCCLSLTSVPDDPDNLKAAAAPPTRSLEIKKNTSRLYEKHRKISGSIG